MPSMHLWSLPSVSAFQNAVSSIIKGVPRPTYMELMGGGKKKLYLFKTVY